MLPEESLRHLDQANQEDMFKVNDRFGSSKERMRATHSHSNTLSSWGKAHEVKSQMSVLAQFPTINDRVGEPQKKHVHIGEEEEEEEERHIEYLSEFVDAREMQRKAIAIIKKSLKLATRIPHAKHVRNQTHVYKPYRSQKA